ncbi:MAG: helix-turn-helix domain-containing protein [Mesorhizobium sp.]|uniref:helix-turn-helix domain-containing protein n=1 Tax=Mesorhizobium sp. TaxID=1871066 RepID=UPI001AD52E70|nr:helix-turn-helix domain-containing protein [Mesorhizobium sp.]MBN9219564.1 helix-turn-helix domain-containing protein [Mesorhizobium sp.]
MESPSYYAVIPATVRYADIAPNAKLLYGEISALSDKFGYCFATNAHFATLYKVQDTTVSAWVKALADSGYIAIEHVRLESGRWERRISLSEPFVKSRSTPSEKAEAPPSENSEENNTRDNTKSNNPPVAPKASQLFLQFWSDYPLKVGKPKAAASWRSQKLDQEAISIFAGLNRWKASPQWKRDGGKFIPHPTTFLNQRRWEDSPEPERAVNPYAPLPGEPVPF